MYGTKTYTFSETKHNIGKDATITSHIRWDQTKPCVVATTVFLKCVWASPTTTPDYHHHSPQKPSTAFAATPSLSPLPWATKECLCHAVLLTSLHERARDNSSGVRARLLLLLLLLLWEKDWSFRRRNGGPLGQEKIGTAEQKSIVRVGERSAIPQSCHLISLSTL